jgi:hypothetical protein
VEKYCGRQTEFKRFELRGRGRIAFGLSILYLLKDRSKALLAGKPAPVKFKNEEVDHEKLFFCY